MRIKWHVEKHPRNSTKIIIIDECPKCGNLPEILEGDQIILRDVLVE